MGSAAVGLVLSWPIRARRAEALPAGSGATALAQRAQAGDDRAFDELMQATLDKILTLSWRLLGSRDEARDAAQETFLRAYRYLHRYRPEHDFEGWLYRIAVNVCRDLRRRRHSSFAGVVSLEAERDAGRIREPAIPSESEERVLDGERRSLVLRALATLTERERAALVLRDLEGRTSDEVARILGSRAGTVRSQLVSARAKLKRAIVRLTRPAPEATP